MKFEEIIQRAKQIRTKYAELEKKRDGEEWTKEQLMQGFLKDVLDLKTILSSHEVNDAKLGHELADCLWSIIILADKYNINLEESFLRTMNELEKHISNQ